MAVYRWESGEPARWSLNPFWPYRNDLGNKNRHRNDGRKKKTPKKTVTKQVLFAECKIFCPASDIQPTQYGSARARGLRLRIRRPVKHYCFLVSNFMFFFSFQNQSFSLLFNVFWSSARQMYREHAHSGRLIRSNPKRHFSIAFWRQYLFKPIFF